MRKLILSFLVIIGAAFPCGGCAVPQSRYLAYAMAGRSTHADSAAGVLAQEAPLSPRGPLPAAVLSDAQAPTPMLTVVDPRKVVYTGQFCVAVGDVAVSIQATKALADKLGGYMLRMTTNTIVIRVPADKFDAAVAELNRMGTMLNKDISAQDVTDQYTDLEMRLKNAKATQQKLLALLEKSQVVRDTMDIEKELQRITTEIERLEGQLNKLSNEVAFSMLTVLFNQTSSAPAETQVKLPFYWLGRIGLNELLSF
jgi:hypothetical protein